MEKTVNTRIQHKRDTSGNWETNNPILLDGEVILVDTAEGELRVKIGDGVNTYSDLPFNDEILRKLIPTRVSELINDSGYLTQHQDISGKVDKVNGKGLSTEDYTTAEKEKLADIAEGANKTVVDSALDSSSANPVQNKVIQAAIAELNSLVGNTSVSTQINNAVANKSDIGHTHTAAEVGADAKGAADNALSEAKDYTEQGLANLSQGFEEVIWGMYGSDITDEGAPTIREIAKDEADTALSSAQTYTDTVASRKSDTTHNHNDDYDVKGAAETKANAVQANLDIVSDELDKHTNDTNIHVTTTDKSNWNTAHTHSQSDHARTDATKVADSTINGNILIDGAETNVYSHPTSGVAAGTYKSVTVNAQGHITSGTNPTTLAGYGITDADSKGAADTALANAKSYTDTKISDLINSAPTTLDTLGEIATAMEENNDIVAALDEAVGSKANASDLTSHTENTTVHITSTERTNWDDANSKKHSHSNKGIIDTITQALIDAWNSAVTHISDTVKHITSTERSNWNAAKTHADSAHAPSAAQKNSDITKAEIEAKLTGSITSHNHNGQYYTETEVDDFLEGKADESHSHAIVDVSGLQSALDGKAGSSHGTHVSYSNTNPVMNGTASVGSAGTVARSDHKHPTDTSRAAASDLTSHTTNTSNPHGVTKSQVGLGNVPNVATNDQTPTFTAATSLATLTSGEKISVAFGKITKAITDLISHIGNKSNPHGITASQVGAAASSHSHTSGEVSGLATVATSGSYNDLSNKPTILSIGTSSTTAAAGNHTHSAYANQNAFSNVAVGSTTIAADSATDTLTLVAGSNVTITPDATNDKVTIAATDTVYTHPSSHAASMITGLATVATSGSYNDLSNKPTIPSAYTHPTSSGNKHIPSGGSSGQILRWSADGTAVWGADNNTTYSNFVKSGSGAKAGLVPAPSTTAGTTKYLREDGTWQVPPDTNTTYSLSSFGITASASELNYTDGVTSTIQTQLNGKAASSHGNHVPTTQTASNSVFLRNDNTWQTVTPANIGAAPAVIYNNGGVANGFTGTITPNDNHYYRFTMGGALTIDLDTDVSLCTRYPAHFQLYTGAAARTLTISDAVNIAGDDYTTMPAYTRWEISILRGQVIVKRTV